MVVFSSKLLYDFTLQRYYCTNIELIINTILHKSQNFYSFYRVNKCYPILFYGVYT